jgi:hypothetical protein
MQRMAVHFSFFLLMTIVGAGCASYEYDISEPGGPPVHVGTKTDVILNLDPLEYRFITVESRLVLRIYNPTENPITLAGERSFAVDPGGQSHPLPTQTMAPHSFIKLIFPPLRPRLERPGPSIGFGVMAGDYRWRDRGYWYDDQPRYLTIYDSDAIYWDWSGESSMRLNLVFQRQQPQGTFEQAFLIMRKKT